MREAIPASSRRARGTPDNRGVRRPGGAGAPRPEPAWYSGDWAPAVGVHAGKRAGEGVLQVGRQLWRLGHRSAAPGEDEDEDEVALDPERPLAGVSGAG